MTNHTRGVRIVAQLVSPALLPFIVAALLLLPTPELGGS